MLKKIADPSYTTEELSAEMLELMSDTSFEDRLPQPLPEGTRVAHKIGSYENTFSDAGIVFPEARDCTNQGYYIVILPRRCCRSGGQRDDSGHLPSSLPSHITLGCSLTLLFLAFGSGRIRGSLPAA
jgi:Beta-lactamase enzyme family